MGRWVVAGAAVALLLAGCGDDGEPGGATPSASAAPTQDAVAAEEATIAKAYRDYLDAFEESAATGDVDPESLRPYATAESAQKDVELLSILFDEGLRQVGDITFEPLSVEVDGDEATLTACTDQSGSVTVKEGEQPSPGQTGLPPGKTEVELVREDGRWLFASTRELGPC